MKTERLFLCLVASIFLGVLGPPAVPQSLTTIITRPQMTWTSDLALADHGAAYIARTVTPTYGDEVFAYVFAVHQLLQLTANKVEDHSLVASGDRLLWVEGRGSTSTLREYLITENRRRTIAKPTGVLELGWLALDQDQALAFETLANGLWQLDLTANRWVLLTRGFRPGQDHLHLNGQDTVWTEPAATRLVLMHRSAGASPRTLRTTVAAIDRVRVRHPYVVWEERLGSLGTWEIMSYDLSARRLTRITTNSYDDTQPVLVGTRVVWIAPLGGTGPAVMHVYDLARGGSIQVIPSQATDLQAAWDGVVFSSGRYGRTLSRYDFLRSRSTTIDTALDINRPDFDGSGGMVMFRKLPNQIRLFMPTFDVRPSDPIAGGTRRVGLYLMAGSLWAFSNYLVGASVSGFRPGINIGLVNVPLNLDAVLFLSLLLANQRPFENTASRLNGFGAQLAFFNPDPNLRLALIGIDIYWAFVLLPPKMASNPVRIRIRP